jgi:ABC-type Na+ transport system ATPase subunit NatA
MIKPIQTASMTVADISVSVLIQDQNLFSEVTNLKQMWVSAEAEDESYNELCQTIHKKQRSFSTVLKVRVFITECFLSDKEKLLFCENTECCSQNLFVQNWFSIHMTQ